MIKDMSFVNDGTSENVDLDQLSHEHNFPPEPQAGNIEYKLKIVSPTEERFRHLVTQLKWRLREGNGEAIYKIGVQDSGILIGLTERDMDISLKTLQEMAGKLGAVTTILRTKVLANNRSVCEVLVRKILDDQNNIEIRVSVLGNADAGKSTLLGVLTQGTLDNGRGKARLNMFRHLHEIRSGRTSSISHEILGFNSDGQPVNYNYSELITAEQICDFSSKLVNFLDLAGHKKYIKTTIQGLSGYSPHHAMLVISSSAGAVGMTQEHLAIALALNIPFFIVITKIDLVDPARMLQSLESFLKETGSRRSPVVIQTIGDVMTAGSNQLTENIVPIFCVSCKTGDGLDLLLKFLYVLPSGINANEKESWEQEPPEFQIDEHFRSGDVNQILVGLLIKGVITEGTKMQIGPMKDGSFQGVIVKTIQRNRVPCRIIRAGQCAGICLNVYISELRNGMVLLSQDVEVKACLMFQAAVLILHHSSAIYPGFQTTMHIGNICQTAVILEMSSLQCIGTNERDLVLFKFMVHPEYLTSGQRLLFRKGFTKCIGEVTKIFPLS